MDFKGGRRRGKAGKERGRSLTLAMNERLDADVKTTTNNHKLHKRERLHQNRTEPGKKRPFLLNLNLLRPSHKLHRPRVPRPTNPHAPLSLQSPNNLRQLRVVNRQRTLRLELLREVGELETFARRGVGGGEEGDDLATEVAAELALVG